VHIGTLFQTFEGPPGVHSVAFSPCGTMIACGYHDGTVRIWNIPSGYCDCVLNGDSRAVRTVCWLATGKQVISASNDHTVRIWDVQRTSLKIVAKYADPVAAVASSDSFLVAASESVTIYDSQSGDIM
jgi:WD40 repeat protein